MPADEQPSLDVQKNYWNDKWDWNRTKYPHEWAWRRGDKIMSYLRSLPVQQPKILDLGCGTGWFAGKLAELGPTSGVDLSAEAIAQAQAQFPAVEFEAGNLFEMDFPKQEYDIVVSQEVIAHVDDQKRYLEIAAGVLKPQGYLVVTTPNRYVNDRMKWPAQPPGHIEQWLSKRDLLSLLASRFRVLGSTTAVPMGDKGLLRVVNSAKLNRVMNLLLSPDRVELMKERAGFGWTLIVLAQKLR